jgi:hypothetical protein
MSGSDIATSQPVAVAGIHRHQGEAAESQREKQRIEHDELLSYRRANLILTA